MDHTQAGRTELCFSFGWERMPQFVVTPDLATTGGDRSGRISTVTKWHSQFFVNRQPNTQTRIFHSSEANSSPSQATNPSNMCARRILPPFSHFRS